MAFHFLTAYVAIAFVGPRSLQHHPKRQWHPQRCAMRAQQPDGDFESLAMLLSSLESVRDWAASEKRSLDTFISELQAEVAELGDEIDLDFNITAMNLEEQSEAFAKGERQTMAARAEALLEELEAKAPPAFKVRGEGVVVPTQKSPFLPRGARIVIAGARVGLGGSLSDDLTAAGYAPREGMERVAANFADPTLPPSFELRKDLEGADCIVLVCSGAADGGVSPLFLTAVSRVLPLSLRRVLLVAPRGCDRTLELEFALANVLGGLDRQRAAEQAIATAAQAVGAVTTVMRVAVGGSSGGSGGGTMIGAARLGSGDVFSGQVGAAAVVRTAREALRRAEAENVRFSVGGGGGDSWDDEFVKLVGPEIGRFATAAEVDEQWVRDWARELPPGNPASKVVCSPYALVDLPTPMSLAAASTVWEADRLPRGVRIRFLASGVEFVDDNEEERIKGDFDGAIDVLAERGRVRVVRAEMEPVWRRLTNGGRRQVAPLVKVTSERRLLKRLAEDLSEFT